MPPRSWGWWTEQKLDILGDYLAAFNKASARSGATVYLGLFAGQAQNVSRSRTEHLIRGSARRALEPSPHSRPAVLRTSRPGSRAQAALETEYPDSRDRFKVVPGDCNMAVAAAHARRGGRGPCAGWHRCLVLAGYCGDGSWMRSRKQLAICLITSVKPSKSGGLVMKALACWA